MSEPVSNAEIEDVLSSIRRLVSENSETTRPSSARVESVEKLVLTPAFRVLDGDASTANDEPQADVEILSDEAETPVENQNDPETVEEFVSEPVNLGLKIAALETAIGDSEEEWEPDGSEQEALAAEPIILHMAKSAHVIDLHAAEETDESQDTEAEPEEIIADAEIIEDISEDISEDILSDPKAVGEDGAFLDEEMLREMVTQLVREELRGEIGERITRNVRRLVRREIKRALAVNDLE